jgi:transcriptional regulator with XRE-family HTH domain
MNGRQIYYRTITVLKQAKKKPTLSNLASQMGFSRRELIEWLAGRSRPHRENLKMIASKLRELGLL